jgi:hypothetical protein
MLLLTSKVLLTFSEVDIIPKGTFSTGKTDADIDLYFPSIFALGVTNV